MPRHKVEQTEASYIRAVELLREQVPDLSAFPFQLPALRQLDKLPLHPKVTYLIGENGMGKSTLLEAIATAWGFNPEGGTLNFNFSTHESHSSLHHYIRLIKGIRRPRDGFFFRAETYYNVATHIEQLDKEPANARRIIDSYGGKSLHAQSHGESFFAAFIHRFSGNGLYLLDEPEAALSPLKQLSLLARIDQLVKMNSQLIISTHSPIVMGYPDAWVYELKEDGIHQSSSVEDTDHFNIMKQFTHNRRAMLKELFAD